MLENSFLLMNRQIWTNVKEAMLARAEEGEEGRCGLCGRQETTMHLMFECEEYSEKVWRQLSEVINGMIEARDGIGNPGIRLHAFQVLYNQAGNIPTRHSKQILELVQEVKRNIVYRRFLRCTTGNALRYNNTRILAHLINIMEKIKTLRQYQSKRCDTIEHLLEVASDRVTRD